MIDMTKHLHVFICRGETLGDALTKMVDQAIDWRKEHLKSKVLKTSQNVYVGSKNYVVVANVQYLE